MCPRNVQIDNRFLVIKPIDYLVFQEIMYVGKNYYNNILIMVSQGLDRTLYTQVYSYLVKVMRLFPYKKL